MEKVKAILETIRSYGSLVVAFSGGVDSSVLTKAAVLALGNRVVAVTAVSELLPKQELVDAEMVASIAGIRHEVIAAEDLAAPELVVNDKERCYFCKKRRFAMLCAWAKENGYAYVADGSNLDDQGDYRPGMRAIAELAPKVVSPFVVCGWTKKDIRQQAKAWDLPVWDKPSAACLASRVEYGIALTPERLRQVEQAETLLHTYIDGQLRVRHHGSLARVELEPKDMEVFWQHREVLTRAIKAVGFTYVTLDLEGYRMGSQNEVLQK